MLECTKGTEGARAETRPWGNLSWVSLGIGFVLLIEHDLFEVKNWVTVGGLGFFWPDLISLE